MFARNLISALVILGTATFAYAGNEGGGGGQGLLCTQPNGKQTVQLLDLWEAHEIYERDIPKSADPVQKQFADAVQRMKNVVVYPYSTGFGDGKFISGADNLAYTLSQTGNYFLQPNWANIKRLRGDKLKLTVDAYEDALPDNCELRQLVRYKDSGLGGSSSAALVDQDLVDKMDATNQAALYLHEALYVEMRKFGETTSLRVRRAVGYVMSGESFASLDSLIQGPHAVCESPDGPYAKVTRVHVIRSHDGLEFVPEVIFGALAMGFSHTNESFNASQTTNPFDSLTTQGWASGIGSPESPVDFDLNMNFDSGIINRDKITIQLDSSSIGIPATQSTIVTCHMVN